eukprot:1782750-Rhodomonas_salina.2
MLVPVRRREPADGQADGSAISLRACYALSGTDKAFGAISLRACYAIPRTDIAYGAVSLRGCYALHGAETAYDAISHYAPAVRCPVLTYHLQRTWTRMRSTSQVQGPLAAYVLATPCPYSVLAYAGSAMASTDRAYGPVCKDGAKGQGQPERLVGSPRVLGMRYAVSGTERGYAGLDAQGSSGERGAGRLGGTWRGTWRGRGGSRALLP